VERSEVEEKINVVLNALPRDYAVVIRLKYMEELSVEQIATDLGVSTKTIESRLFRARTSFKTLWTR
jgi:RNA polymerase sigma-70 factor (ECF subfamily)